MDFRHRMNRLDSQANCQALDSLTNYETVKYFGSEATEFDRYDDTLRDWKQVAVKSQSSMSILNFGQGGITTHRSHLDHGLRGPGGHRRHHEHR